MFGFWNCLFVCFCELVCCCSGLVLVLSEWAFFLFKVFVVLKGRWEVGSGWVCCKKKYTLEWDLGYLL